MEKPWWLKKNEPVVAYEDGYDVSDTYYGDKKTQEAVDDNGYENYEDGDTNDVGVAWSEEEAKAIAKANEPLKKIIFSPKNCQVQSFC